MHGNWKRASLLSYLVITVPVCIALTQLYFYTFSDLTSWKGGGFGMYAEPHPNSSRSVWIEGLRNGNHTAFRIYPLDKRLKLKSIKSNDVQKILNKMSAVAKKGKNFPSNTDFKTLKKYLHILHPKVLDKYPTLQVFPTDSVHYKVMQIEITNDFKGLISKPIHTSKL